jgi:predicted nucleotidyltransferase component of viral defense system
VIARRRRFGVRIAAIQRETGFPHDSLLRDHALSYMLAGIAAVPDLAHRVAFKGGTSLRKCYFRGYRLSEDLDFSSRDFYRWSTPEITTLLEAACATARTLAEEIEAPYTFTPQYVQHREDKSQVQRNFRINVEYPTGARLPIKLELTQVEPIFWAIEVRPVMHDFPEEPFDAAIPVYALEEVVLEKLRAFLQTAINLDRRDWTNRARDLYDLWWLHSQGVPISWGDLLEPLGRKAEARNVAFNGPQDFLDRRVLRSYRDSWVDRLANVVPALPEFEAALHALRTIIGVIFAVDPPAVYLD